MEKIAFYQQCIKTLLSQYERCRSEGSQLELIFDDERMRYLAVWIGWYKSKRIYQCAVHIDIVDEIVIIQCNDTEDFIASELVNMGIEEDRIRLGFLPLDAQFELTENAAKLSHLPTTPAERFVSDTHLAVG